jgi:hypothetical protein
MSRTHTLTLDPPIDAGKGAKVAEVTLREPTLDEMARALAGGTAYAQSARLLSIIGGIDEVVAFRIPASQHAEATEFFAGFTPEEAEIEALDVGNPHVMTFDPPIAFGKQTFDHLTLAEPTLGMLDRAFQQPNNIRQMVHLVAQSAGVPLPVAGAIPYSRIGEITRFFRPFI